jgi:AraC-like DNA-binding protein
MQKHPQTSTPHNSTDMDPIQEAIADLESQEQREQLSYLKLAQKWGVNRVTLARRCKGIQGTRADEGINRRKSAHNKRQGL